MGKRDFPREGSFSGVVIEEISYFVGVFPRKGYRVAVFLENFLPFYEHLSRLILDEMNTLFWDLLPDGEGKNPSPAFLDSFAARTYRLRREQRGYLRLLQLKEQKFSNPSSCSLEGFFRYLSEALGKRGLSVESVCPEGAAVKIDSAALSFLILNLVHFAYLIEGENKIRIVSSKKKDGYMISLRFFDKEGFLDVMQSLLMGDKTSFRALLSVPFLCVARLCGGENFPWSAEVLEKEVKIEFLLPASDTLPDSFLSDATAKEVKELLKAEKEYFS